MAEALLMPFIAAARCFSARQVVTHACYRRLLRVIELAAEEHALALRDERACRDGLTFMRRTIAGMLPARIAMFIITTVRSPATCQRYRYFKVTNAHFARFFATSPFSPFAAIRQH